MNVVPFVTPAVFPTQNTVTLQTYKHCCEGSGPRLLFANGQGFIFT